MNNLTEAEEEEAHQHEYRRMEVAPEYLECIHCEHVRLNPRVGETYLPTVFA